MKKCISVIGLGKLGASMAAGFASREFSVIGYDINDNSVKDIQEGIAPVQETDLQKYISDFRDNITATSDMQKAIDASHISFVVIPTPSEENGSFSLSYARLAFKAIGKALKNKNDYHVIVMTSTVLPGSTRGSLIPILEKESGKTCGVDFGVCYNPEFIALGSVIKDFLNPDFYLLGEFDKKSGDVLESVHMQVSNELSPVKRMTIENAELAKVALNSYVTLKVSFANMLAEFCEKLPNGNVDDVSDALGMDTRIGRKYLTGGLGFAGPCFPRDNVALDFLGKELDIDTRLLSTNQDYNEELMPRYYDRVKQHIKKGDRICVLGLAYKALSHIVEKSAGVSLCNVLSDQGHDVIAHDNLAIEEARPKINTKVVLTDDLEKALCKSDVIFVTTFDNDYINLNADKFSKNASIIDFWRSLSHLSSNKNINYVPMGKEQANSSFQRLYDLWS